MSERSVIYLCVKEPLAFVNRNIAGTITGPDKALYNIISVG